MDVALSKGPLAEKDNISVVVILFWGASGTPCSDVPDGVPRNTTVAKVYNGVNPFSSPRGISEAWSPTALSHNSRDISSTAT